MQLWQYCLLVTAELLYMFRTLSASIIRSTIFPPPSKNQLFFITEENCVFCDLQIESGNF